MKDEVILNKFCSENTNFLYLSSISEWPKKEHSFILQSDSYGFTVSYTHEHPLALSDTGLGGDEENCCACTCSGAEVCFSRPELGCASCN